MSEFEIVKSEYNALGEDNNYKTHYLKTSADQVVGLGRMKSFSYAVGDVVYTDNNMQVALKCVTAGTTSADELDISSKNIGDTVTDGGVVWQVVSRVSDGMPVGFKYFDWVKEIPVGAVGALGVLYNRELYADLWKAAQENKQVITEAEWQALAEANDGNVPWYSDGDGSTTFRVPALKCWFKGASGIEEVGNYLEAGLPNVTGRVSGDIDTRFGVFWRDNFASGAFKATQGANWGASFDSNAKNINLELDASRCSSVYRDDIDTVQPPSLIGIWLIKAFGTVTNVGNVDVAEIAKDYERIASSYLPLSGGIMTGDIVFSNSGYLGFVNDTLNNYRYFALGSSSWNNGARLHLYTNDSGNDSGAFAVATTSANGNTKTLFCSADGRFTWDDRNVLTSYGSFVVLEQTDANPTFILPAGGTWDVLVFTMQGNGNYSWINIFYSMAGGSTITAGTGLSKAVAIAFRTA